MKGKGSNVQVVEVLLLTPEILNRGLNPTFMNIAAEVLNFAHYNSDVYIISPNIQ